MKRGIIAVIILLLTALHAMATHRHWTVADGLPTGEVQQIVELPNGQMLVNCEGVFCIANGSGFDLLPCDYAHAYRMAHHADAYGRLWQGDSLLWLHDFYRVYLFDARRRAFRYDIAGRLTADDALERFARGEVLRDVPDARQWRAIDSLGLAPGYATMTQDRQGGLWIGTRNDGIVYLSPHRPVVRQLSGGHPLIGIARSTQDRQGRIWSCKTGGVEVNDGGTFTLYDTGNVAGLTADRATFISQLADHRYLLCVELATLGYFDPERRTFTSLNSKLPALNDYRRFVGACPIDRQWTIVYAQNGIFMLDTQADTLATFAPADEIEHYATKYNCMLKTADGCLWAGTQNGLFRLSPQPAEGGHSYACERVEGLTNNCIRSLAADGRGRVWAGTSQGISRITPTVVNLGAEDGIPPTSMMERAACLTADGRLAFAIGGAEGVVFHPDSVIDMSGAPAVVITSVRIGDETTFTSGPLHLSHRQNSLTLHFSTLDYATPSHNHYRYRLAPLEQQWTTSSDASGCGRAVYTNLPPDHYRFEVQAAMPNGEWGEPTTLDVTVRPPLWLTWWARLLYALAAVAAVTLLLRAYIRRRQQQLERENDERVNRLFELRDAARHQFTLAVNIDPVKITANKDEEALVEKMLKAIADNMDDLDYTVDMMARDVGMSRASLYKKTQQMLGITPNDFLRNVRLKHAARLLVETDEPVNQISLMVGFQTSRYFSQCFRQTFGMTPTEYRSAERQAAGQVQPSSISLQVNR